MSWNAWNDGPSPWRFDEPGDPYRQETTIGNGWAEAIAVVTTGLILVGILAVVLFGR